MSLRKDIDSRQYNEDCNVRIVPRIGFFLSKKGLSLGHPATTEAGGRLFLPEMLFRVSHWLQYNERRDLCEEEDLVGNCTVATAASILAFDKYLLLFRSYSVGRMFSAAP